ncbi:MAG TPA: septation protein SepH [Streptosporangiaceae bacterium]
MQELRLVAVSEDGSYAVLVVPGRSGRFALPIDERLRTVARGQFSRLAQYEIEVESPLRPKEIQDRIRAGETAEEIADAAGLPLDRIRRFEGPVLAEREFRAKEAQRATVRGQSGPGPRLGEIVTERLAEEGANGDEVDWDSRKRQDGNWQVQLAYTVAGRMYVAEWVYDPRSKHVTPDDDEATRLCLSEDEWPGPRQPVRQAATATVTPIRSGPSGSHQQDRAHADRSHSGRAAGNGIMHPSMQGPAGVAAGGPRAARLAGRAGDAVQPAPPGPGHRFAERGEAAPPAAGGAGPQGPNDRQEQADGPQDEVVAAGRRPAAAAEDKPAAEARQPKRRSSGGRSRRSSVPSWDEIMFGNSRQPD